MYAYKGFTKDLTAVLGRGTFKFVPNKWYKEEEANCVQNGFHCAENPLDTLQYYPFNENNVFCKVEVKGDIHESGYLSVISATQLRIVKVLTTEEFVAAAMAYIIKHPLIEMARQIDRNYNEINNEPFHIVYGSEPRAIGKMGDVLGLIKESEDSPIGFEVGIYKIDGENYIAGTYYDVYGNKVS